MAYVSTNHIRDKEVKVRLNSYEDEAFEEKLNIARARHSDRLTRAQYMRIIEKVYHLVPPEVTDPIFEQIIRENPNA